MKQPYEMTRDEFGEYVQGLAWDSPEFREILAFQWDGGPRQWRPIADYQKQILIPRALAEGKSIPKEQIRQGHDS